VSQGTRPPFVDRSSACRTATRRALRCPEKQSHAPHEYWARLPTELCGHRHGRACPLTRLAKTTQIELRERWSSAKSSMRAGSSSDSKSCMLLVQCQTLCCSHSTDHAEGSGRRAPQTKTPPTQPAPSAPLALKTQRERRMLQEVQQTKPSGIFRELRGCYNLCRRSSRQHLLAL